MVAALVGVGVEIPASIERGSAACDGVSVGTRSVIRWFREDHPFTLILSPERGRGKIKDGICRHINNWGRIYSQGITQ